MIRVVVGVLLRDGKVLVAERPPCKPYSGYWEFPGGKVEVNEQDADALKREMNEELGIEVLSSSKLVENTHTYPDKTVHLHIWLVTDFAGEPHGRENQQLRWVTYEEMQQLRLLDGNIAVMEQLRGVFSKA